jgi:hypothetical protein
LQGETVCSIILKGEDEKQSTKERVFGGRITRRFFGIHHGVFSHFRGFRYHLDDRINRPIVS